MPATPDVDGAWSRLEAALADAVPSLLADLAPPASATNLDALAERTDLDVRLALDDLYGHHDGQRSPTPGVFFGLQFLPAAAAADEWSRWASMVQDDPALVSDVVVQSEPVGDVQPVYFSPSWVPFAVDGAGNGLAVDLAPGPGGVTGQVISFGADETVRRVLAPSVAAFLAWCASAWESGEATVVDDPDAVGGQAPRIRGASHLLDVADELFG